MTRSRISPVTAVIALLCGLTGRAGDRDESAAVIWSGKVTSPVVARAYTAKTGELRFLAYDEVGSFLINVNVAAATASVRRLAAHSAGFIWQGFDDIGETVGIGRNGSISRSPGTGHQTDEVVRLGFRVRAVRERHDIPGPQSELTTGCAFVLGTDTGAVVVLRAPAYSAYGLSPDTYAALLTRDDLYVVERKSNTRTLRHFHGPAREGITNTPFPGDVTPLGFVMVATGKGSLLIWPEIDRLLCSRWLGHEWGPRDVLLDVPNSDELLSSYEWIIGSAETELHVVLGEYLHILTLDHRTGNWRRSRVHLGIAMSPVIYDIRAFCRPDGAIVLSYLDTRRSGEANGDAAGSQHLCIRLLKPRGTLESE